MIPEQFKEFKFCLCCVYIDTHQNEDIKIVLVPERAFSQVLFFKDTFDESTVCVCVCSTTAFSHSGSCFSFKGRNALKILKPQLTFSCKNTAW